jgi:hypothetical protein
MDSRAYADCQDDGEVYALSEDYTRTIFSSLKHRQEIVASHGNIILTRWNKKSETGRKDTVREVAPDMLKEKLPQAHLHYDNYGWIPKRKYRKTWLLPYLTVDNLCDDKSKLLTLFCARALHDPEKWMMFDAEQVHDAYARGVIEVRFHPACVVTHGKDYGSLVEWNQGDAHAWNIVGWPKARLILEAQAELMQFLVKMANKLVGDYQGVSGADKLQQKVSHGFTPSGSQEQWSGFSRAGFTAPSTFDPISLLEIARNRMAVAEDELELLQTEPAYMLAKTNELRKLEFHKQLSRVNKEWPFVVSTIIYPALSRARYWRWIVQDLEWICVLHDKYAKGVSLGRQLPKEYALGLGSLQRMLINLQSQQIRGLGDLLHSLRSTQKHLEYVQDPVHGPVMNISTNVQEPVFKDMIVNDPLHWAVYQLQATIPREIVTRNKSVLF